MNIKNSSKGITLIALVVTVIVLLILAVVAINLTIGDNGIFNRAQNATTIYDIESVREELNMALVDIEMEKVEKGYTKEEFDGKLNDLIYARLPECEIVNDTESTISYKGYVFDLIREVPKLGEYIGEAGNLPPRIRGIQILNKTDNSARVNVTVARGEDVRYIYYIKELAQLDSEYVKKDEGISNTLVFYNLNKTTKYEIKVEIYLNNELQDTMESVIILATLDEATLNISNPVWSNGKASVTVSTDIDFQIEYQILKQGQTEVGSWIQISNNQTILDLVHGDTVCVRLNDGEETSDMSTKEIIDSVAPSATISLGATSVDTNTPLSVTVTQTDEQSGIDISKCKYIWTQSNASLGLDESSYTEGTFTSAIQSLNKTFTTEGAWYLHVLTIDIAGNRKETISNKVDVKINYIGYYADIEGDGTVDGVIYADMRIGGSVQWGNCVFTIPTISSSKNYYIIQSLYEGKFGTKPVLAPKGSEDQRFYVMSLTDLDSSTHTWYKSALGEMTDYAKYTSIDFGTGKQNTSKMITKWNNSGYGAQNSNDIWGLSSLRTKVKEGWFVPSRDEWAAFGDVFNITNSNYINFGLKDRYWSSSQVSENTVWRANFTTGLIGSDFVSKNYCIRLITIF